MATKDKDSFSIWEIKEELANWAALTLPPSSVFLPFYPAKLNGYGTPSNKGSSQPKSLSTLFRS